MAHPKIIAIAGSKGGIGKTVLSANLSIYLASIGRRVVALDADAQGPNLHGSLGIAPEVVRENSRGPGADPQLLPCSIPDLHLWSPGVDQSHGPLGRRTSLREVHARIGQLAADYVVVDLGAGVRPELVRLWLDAHMGLYVLAPDPGALENTHRFVRRAFATAVLRVVHTQQPHRREAMRRHLRSMGHTPSPMDLVRRLEAAGDPLSPVVRETIDGFALNFIVSQTRARSDLELGDALRSAIRRREGLNPRYFGYVDFDETVVNTSRICRPLLIENPAAKASRCLERIARRLMTLDAGKLRQPLLNQVPPGSHHDMLEVDRGASEEEVRRAHKRMREIFTHNALACYGLFSAKALEAVRARVEEAHDVLLDPARRRTYEVSVFPESTGPRSSRPAPRDEASLPAAPRITAETEFNGATLRAVRESMGLELRDISSKTKIGTAYLDAIECESFFDLPAPVYTRGFVVELAKCLKLDPEHVAQTYMRRFNQARGRGAA